MSDLYGLFCLRRFFRVFTEEPQPRFRLFILHERVVVISQSGRDDFNGSDWHHLTSPQKSFHWKISFVSKSETLSVKIASEWNPPDEDSFTAIVKLFSHSFKSLRYWKKNVELWIVRFDSDHEWKSDRRIQEFTWCPSLLRLRHDVLQHELMSQTSFPNT